MDASNGLSNPIRCTYFSLLENSKSSSISFKYTPVHLALKIAPPFHGNPNVESPFLLNSIRRFPAHWIVDVTV